MRKQSPNFVFEFIDGFIFMDPDHQISMMDKSDRKPSSNGVIIKRDF